MGSEQNIERITAANPIIAVVTVDDASHAVPLAHALLEGGIGATELTLRTPSGFGALAAIRRECPEMCAGVGTVLTPEQVQQAAAGDAAFAVAPGLSRRVVEATREAGLPFAPGAATPSDIEAAIELGCRTLKFFPAEPSGGASYLLSMATPYAHLGLGYIPLGGLNTDNFSRYLSLYRSGRRRLVDRAAIDDSFRELGWDCWQRAHRDHEAERECLTSCHRRRDQDEDHRHLRGNHGPTLPQRPQTPHAVHARHA